MIAPLVHDAFAAIGSLEQAGNRVGLLQAFLAWTARFGLDRVLVTSQGTVSTPDGTARVNIIATNWPRPSVVRYEVERRWVIDPALRLVAEARRPITMGEVVSATKDQAEASVVEEYAAAGCTRGVVVPITQAGRVTGTVGAFGQGARDADHEAQVAVALTAPVMLRRSLALATDTAAERGRGQQKPTNRELECLALSASGKSSAEIAQLLELSEHTVNTHLRSAIDKLKAGSRVQAVAEAMRRGWIA